MPSRQAGLSCAPRQTREEAAAKYLEAGEERAAPCLVGAGERQEVLGVELGAWAGASGAQAAKASSPADPSQKQESPYLAGKGVLCRNVCAKHRSHGGKWV